MSDTRPSQWLNYFKSGETTWNGKSVRVYKLETTSESVMQNFTCTIDPVSEIVAISVELIKIWIWI